MSDQEINKLVYLKVKPEREAYKDCRVGNYCEYPSDAWPIILENKISIISSNDGYYATDDVDSFLEPDGKAPWDKNPLRSAMIVYLMMGEG